MDSFFELFSLRTSPSFYKIIHIRAGPDGGTFMTEEQAHVAWLKDRASNLGLTFSEYMLFLIFETLDHSTAINPEQLSAAPWETAE